MAWEEGGARSEAGSGGRAVEGCGRAGAAEIAWEEAREARSKVRIRWTGGGRAVDGQCRNSMGGG